MQNLLHLTMVNVSSFYALLAIRFQNTNLIVAYNTMIKHKLLVLVLKCDKKNSWCHINYNLYCKKP